MLADASSGDVDLLVFGGDLAWGAFPKQTLERVRDPGLPALYVRGNADREVAEPAGDGWEVEIARWCSEQLDDDQRRFLQDQAETLTVDVEGVGEVLFCHGSPRSDEERLTFLTPDERMRKVVEGVSAAVVVCGHTHMQFDRRCGDVRVVNAGSVGMPYEGRPGAYWCLLDASGISLRRTEFDFAAASAAVASSGCPHAEEMASDVVSPPGRQETAELFEPGE